MCEKNWQPIDTAPKGGGAEYTNSPEWVEPPRLLLLCPNNQIVIGYYDWFYSEQGGGYKKGISGWTIAETGEQVALNYREPTHWMSLPELPKYKRCPSCGYAVTVTEIDAAKHNYPCPRCNKHGIYEMM